MSLKSSVLVAVTTLLVTTLFGTVGAAGADVRFAEQPTVAKEGNGFRITFAADAATDCTVAILDQDGKTVRHLAAGSLGERAPAPLAPNVLRQALVWDGNDDRGQVAVGGPFRVRVGLGVRPQLHGFIGDNPAALGSVRSLAVGPRGEVFVFHVFGELHPSDGTSSCSVFDRHGNYLRTILPFPAGLPEDRLAGLKRITREDGTQVPFFYQAETRSILPGAGDLPPERAVATRDGRVALVGIREGPHRYAQAGVANLLVLRGDGGVPRDGYLGAEISSGSSSGASLALSPDEQTIYAAGIKEGSSGGGKPLHAVLRFGWKGEKPEVFAGDKSAPGAAADSLDTPRSVAVDSAGNVYVADSGNNRVAVFKPDGSFLGALAVTKPERVEVHPGTGAVYVLGGERVDMLQKFAAWNRPQPVAELKLPSFKHPRYTVVAALDAAAEPPVIWLGTPFGSYAKFDLLRIEDLGDRFGALNDVGRKNNEARPTAGSVLGMDYDRAGRRLLVNTFAYGADDDSWGKGLREASGKSINNMGVGSFGLDGNFYTQIYPRIVRRFDGDLKRFPFAALTADKGDLLNPIQGTMRVRGRGVTADVAGNVYVLWEDGVDSGRGAAFNHVYVYHPDGSLKKEKLIASEIRSVNSVRVDRRGNVYLALGLRPGQDLLPPYLREQLPDGAKDADAVGGLNSYPLIYGSIAKFGPAGGRIRKDAGGIAANYAFGVPISIEGAEWVHSGSSPVVSWRTPGTPDICNCESPRFDVDDYGRSFFPDAAACRVGMLDTNGNFLGWFGEYGNVDSAGEKSSVPAPAIPLFWPYSVAVGDDSVYVGDRLNRRVVRVRLAYAAEATQPLP
jgi:hypothetical protein